LPKKIYVVELTEQERDHLKGLVSKGKAAAYKRRHAQILLKAGARVGDRLAMVGLPCHFHGLRLLQSAGLEVYSNAGLRHRLVDMGRRRASSESSEKAMVQRHEELYRWIMERRGAPWRTPTHDSQVEASRRRTSQEVRSAWPEGQ